MATRGAPIRYNNDYTSVKSAVDAALARVGASFTWSNTVTGAGQTATAAQVTALKNAVDTAWSRYCNHSYTCSNRSSCTNNAHTFQCGNRSSCTNNAHTFSCGNRSSCTNNAHRTNRANNADGSSNSANNGDNGSVWSSFCYSVYRNSRKCGGELDWRTLGHLLSQVRDL